MRGAHLPHHLVPAGDLRVRARHQEPVHEDEDARGALFANLASPPADDASVRAVHLTQELGPDVDIIHAAATHRKRLRSVVLQAREAGEGDGLAEVAARRVGVFEVVDERVAGVGVLDHARGDVRRAHDGDDHGEAVAGGSRRAPRPLDEALMTTAFVRARGSVSPSCEGSGSRAKRPITWPWPGDRSWGRRRRSSRRRQLRRRRRLFPRRLLQPAAREGRTGEMVSPGRTLPCRGNRGVDRLASRVAVPDSASVRPRETGRTLAIVAALDQMAMPPAKSARRIVP